MPAFTMYLYVFVFSFRALSSIFDFWNLVWASCRWEPSTALRDERHESALCAQECRRRRKLWRAAPVRLTPVTVGDLRASNTATASSRVDISTGRSEDRSPSHV